jgi:hypothetical protein
MSDSIDSDSIVAAGTASEGTRYTTSLAHPRLRGSSRQSARSLLRGAGSPRARHTRRSGCSQGIHDEQEPALSEVLDQRVANRSMGALPDPTLLASV